MSSSRREDCTGRFCLFGQLFQICVYGPNHPSAGPATQGPGPAVFLVVPSRRRDCHFADISFSIAIEMPAQGRGGCSRMTVSPTADRAARAIDA